MPADDWLEEFTRDARGRIKISRLLFRTRITQLISLLAKRKEIIVITSHNKPDVVLVSKSHFDELERVYREATEPHPHIGICL